MTVPRRAASERGFTIVEMVVAAGLLVLVTGATFAIFNPSQGTFQVQPEVADMQQRMRVGFDVVQRDLVNAGAGLSTGAMRGPLVSTLASVLPYRLGTVDSDPLAGRFFRADAITVIHVPGRAPQSSLSVAPAARTTPLQVNLEAGCLAGDPACGFRTGMRAVVLDDTGWFDTFTLTGVDPATRLLSHADDALTKLYAAGAQVAQVAMTTYYLDANERDGTYRLMRYDGHRTDLPVVEDVVGLSFEYFGEAGPARLLRPVTEAEGPWTNYGPRPPEVGVNNPADVWGAGENCVFEVVAGAHRSRVASLGADSTTVPLAPAMLVDGPWCPDATAPHRFDADLLRIRKIRMTLRVQVGSRGLRGPAGGFFARGGVSRNAERFVPDQEVRLDVTPRNLTIGR